MKSADKPPQSVTATEIASWVYCPESFRLAKLGHESSNQTIRQAGTRHHAELAQAYVASEPTNWPTILGRVLIALAVLALAWSLLG